MSRDSSINSGSTQLTHVGGLPIRGDYSAWGGGNASTALGAPMPQQQAPLKKLHRRRRGLYIVAGVLGLVFGIVGAYFWNKAAKPLYTSVGLIEIEPTMPSAKGADHLIPMYTAMLNSQATMLTTDRVIEPAMMSEAWTGTGRGSYHDLEVLDKFKKSLTVGVMKNQFYVRIEFLDEDPIVAQTAVNVLLAAYKPIAEEEGIGAAKNKIDTFTAYIRDADQRIDRLQNQVKERSQKYQT